MWLFEVVSEGLCEFFHLSLGALSSLFIASFASHPSLGSVWWPCPRSHACLGTHPPASRQGVQCPHSKNLTGSLWSGIYYCAITGCLLVKSHNLHLEHQGQECHIGCLFMVIRRRHLISVGGSWLVQWFRGCFDVHQTIFKSWLCL